MNDIPIAAVVYWSVAVFCFGAFIGSAGLVWLLWQGINSKPKDAHCEPFTLEKAGAVLERVHGVRTIE